MQMVMRFVLLGALGVGIWARAATPFKSSLTLPVKKGVYIKEGLIQGGQAGPGVALTGVRRAFSPSVRMERLILDLGDSSGKPTQHLGYFQASLDAGGRRAVMDISQLKLSQVSEAQIRGLFAKSPFVEGVDLVLDQQDLTGSLVLRFKRPMQMEVFHLKNPKATARVVMDFKPQVRGG